MVIVGGGDRSDGFQLLLQCRYTDVRLFHEGGQFFEFRHAGVQGRWSNQSAVLAVYVSIHKTSGSVCMTLSVINKKMGVLFSCVLNF